MATRSFMWNQYFCYVFTSEERNRLRLQAWEQRNQETGQAKEQNPENVPLFREPYKVHIHSMSSI